MIKKGGITVYQKQCCPKCGADAMLYYDRNAIWICGKCRSLFSSYMDEIDCDDALFHKLLLYLASEQDALRDELINKLPDPRVLISIESEDDEEENDKHDGIPPERRIIYQEVYHMIKQLNIVNRSKIPKNTLDFLDRARDRDYVPDFDITKSSEETKKISREALALFAHLNMEYMSSPEEKERLGNVYKQNSVKHERERTELLCRLIRESDEFDWVAQSERLDSFPKICAEVCRAIEYLPLDTSRSLFADEDLIDLLRCRDYGFFVKLKDDLFEFNRMSEKVEYKGSVEAIQFLKGLAEVNDCIRLLSDEDRS
ncbi:MAG: hypothetical protein IJG07_10550 [Prevotella sp.]|nr:hypothetical protein [Prevotella sp.]